MAESKPKAQQPPVEVTEAAGAIDALDRFFRPLLGEGSYQAGPLGALTRFVGEAEGRVAVAARAREEIEADVRGRHAALEALGRDLVAHEERVTAEKQRLAAELEAETARVETAKAAARRAAELEEDAVRASVRRAADQANAELARIRKEREQEEATLRGRVEGLRVEEQQLAQAVGRLKSERDAYLESAQRIAAGQ